MYKRKEKNSKIIKKTYDEIGFQNFILSFYSLTPEYMNIITRLLRNMEHPKDPNFGKEDFSDSIIYLKEKNNYTYSKIAEIIGRANNMNKDYAMDLVPTIKSAIKRTSRGSDCFNDILNVLETDIIELEGLSDYYNNEEKYGNLKWLYDNISDRNKQVVQYLMKDLILLIDYQNDNFESDGNYAEDYEEIDEE